MPSRAHWTHSSPASRSPYEDRMPRVSSPDVACALAGPYASTRVTEAPICRMCSAVHPPHTPAPTTTTFEELLPSFGIRRFVWSPGTAASAGVQLLRRRRPALAPAAFRKSLRGNACSFSESGVRPSGGVIVSALRGWDVLRSNTVSWDCENQSVVAREFLSREAIQFKSISGNCCFRFFEKAVADISVVPLP